MYPLGDLLTAVPEVLLRIPQERNLMVRIGTFRAFDLLASRFS